MSTPILRASGRLLSAAGLVALLGGVPVALLATHGSPSFGELMRAIGHPQSWGHALSRQYDDEVVVKTVTLFAWASWAWLSLCVVLEAAATLRGVPVVRLPGSRYCQSVAAVMVGATFALLPNVRFVSQL